MSRALVAIVTILAFASQAIAVTDNFDHILLGNSIGPLGSENGGGGGGHGGVVRRALLNFADARIDLLNTSNETEVNSAVIDIEVAARSNATRITNALKNAYNLSDFVRAAHEQGTGNGTGANGTRTNLSVARSVNGLAEAVIAIHNELGVPLDSAMELDTRQRTALLSPNAAKASALIIYATIDAMHYRAAAFAGVDQASLDIVIQNPEYLSMLHRRMSFANAGGQLELTFDANTTRIIEAAVNVTNSLPPTALNNLYQALDVLSQATDEARQLLLPDGTLPSTEMSNCVKSTSKVLFASPTGNCEVVLGGDEGAVYDYMRIADGEKNAVLIDFGGSDTYVHRAGGGRGVVQVLVDLKSGADLYDRGGRSAGDLFESAATQGGGSNGGIGFLFDEGGDDQYRAVSGSSKALQSQGAALFGAGMLIDNAGNDIYYARQEGSQGSHAQGSAVGTAVGILRDLGGQDSYTFEVTPPSPLQSADGGGAQGYAAMTGGAYLLDYGNTLDTYLAGQDEVQGAATTQAFALFHDDGGTNTIRIKSSVGCATLYNLVCDTLPMSEWKPVAGWSQAYADTNGTAFTVLGPGGDTLNIQEVTGTYDRTNEGHSTLGVGNSTALAVLLNIGGSDNYEAYANSLGNGNSGMGIFSDTGGSDAYLCSVVTCYGDGISLGVGIYYDGVSSGDTFADGNSRLVPWARGDFGIGVHQGG